MAKDTVPVPVYLPREQHRWLMTRKLAGHGSLSSQVNRYVMEGRIRDELAEAVAEVQPSPGGLDAIQARIRKD